MTIWVQISGTRMHCELPYSIQSPWASGDS